MSRPSKPVQNNDNHGRVFSMLSGVVDGGTTLSFEEQTHVEECLVCQAELVRYRRLLRALHELRTSIIRPAPGLLADILGGLAERGEQKAITSIITGRRAAYASGIALATVAGLAGAVLLAGRSRKTTQKAA